MLILSSKCTTEEKEIESWYWIIVYHLKRNIEILACFIEKVLFLVMFSTVVFSDSYFNTFHIRQLTKLTNMEDCVLNQFVIIAGLLHGFLLDIYSHYIPYLLYFLLRHYICFQNVGSQHAWQRTSTTWWKQGRRFLDKWRLYHIHRVADGSNGWAFFAGPLLQRHVPRAENLRWCISSEPSSPSAKCPHHTQSTCPLKGFHCLLPPSESCAMV